MGRAQREQPDSIDRELRAEEIQALIDHHRQLNQAEASLAETIAEMACSPHVRVTGAPGGAAHLRVRSVLPWPQAVEILKMLKGQPRA